MSSARRRVLIVDDDDLFRRALRTVLDEDGRLSVVGEAATGVEALSLVERLHPDVVVLDFDMPLLDGFSTYAAIAERWPGLSVVMLTGSFVDEKEQIAMLGHLPILLHKDRFEPRSICDALVGPPLH